VGRREDRREGRWICERMVGPYTNSPASRQTGTKPRGRTKALCNVLNRPGNQPSKRRNPPNPPALCCAANLNRTTHTHTHVAPLKSRRLDRRHGPGGLGNLETRKPAASSASQSGTDGSGQVNGLPHLGVLAHSEAEETCIIGTYLKQARVLLPSPSSLLPFPCLPTHDHTEQDMTVSQSVGPLTHSRTHSLPSHIPLAPRMEQVQFGDTFPVPLFPLPQRTAN